MNHGVDSHASSSVPGSNKSNLVSENFIEEIINQNLSEGLNGGRVVTRFPPEPNGYLHIGHAKSICLNFGLSLKYGKGPCHLRFDDTNPDKENIDYINSIKEDVKWLGFDWGTHEYYASDYFDQLYDYALELIRQGKAYVCELTPEQVREYRGTLTEPGRESPFRHRTVDENLSLFNKMKQGEVSDGTLMLRAKIDMNSGNLNMRDPIIYRVKKTPHHRTGSKWNIYPMYDFTHPISDAIEAITHSICTLEFEDHRPLYDWMIENISIANRPRQIEFARLNLSHSLMSKRKLNELVDKKIVSGWDDPRMPTISGLRRRGYTPESIRDFCQRIGVAKRNSMVDYALLEACVREHLNQVTPRYMAVLRPLKVLITNFPEGQTEWLMRQNNPDDPAMGERPIPFSRELFIEQDDFMEDPPKNFFRLGPGREVRLRYGFFITCQEVIKNPVTGEIEELRCTYDPDSRGGQAPDGRKVKGTIHWVSRPHCHTAQVRLYQHLFLSENPSASESLESSVNPDSLEVIAQARVEPELAKQKPGLRCQFERLGYFYLDAKEYDPANLIFNRTVTLRDTWGKINQKQAGTQR